MKSSTTSESLFVDTWGWLVLANDRDPSFALVAGLRREHAVKGHLWVTSDYVLDETITRLFAAAPFSEARAFCDGIFESQKLRLLVVEPITQRRFQAAYRLRSRYRDTPRISFTDLTSFAVMQELGIRSVLTADAHFIQAGFGFRRLP